MQMVRSTAIVSFVLLVAAPAATVAAGSATPGTSVVQRPRHCTITGTPEADVLRGTRRDDVVCGYNGRDRIRSGPGDDVVYAGRGVDMVDGERGNDTLAGQAAGDDLYGGKGDDALLGGRGDDYCVGNGGTDIRHSCGPHQDARTSSPARTTPAKRTCSWARAGNRETLRQEDERGGRRYGACAQGSLNLSVDPRRLTCGQRST
jgi:hypothetical protein